MREEWSPEENQDEMPGENGMDAKQKETAEALDSKIVTDFSLSKFYSSSYFCARNTYLGEEPLVWILATLCLRIHSVPNQ